ncbi:MAG: hypothetical protein ACKOCT_09245 [Alphaproteobacteria bacterium]
MGVGVGVEVGATVGVAVGAGGATVAETTGAGFVRGATVAVGAAALAGAGDATLAAGATLPAGDAPVDGETCCAPTAPADARTTMHAKAAGVHPESWRTRRLFLANQPIPCPCRPMESPGLRRLPWKPAGSVSLAVAQGRRPRIDSPPPPHY